MSKKDMCIIFLMVLFVAVIIPNDVFAEDVQGEYKAVPFFDELYSTFWSGYLNLSFVNRGWIGWGSLMTLAIIGGIVIKKMPGILQLTFLPTFYVGTYQFNGQDISHGFQIMSNGTALSDFVNMSFTLIWLMLWGGLAAFVAVMLFFGFEAALKGAGNAVNNESRQNNTIKIYEEDSWCFGLDTFRGKLTKKEVEEELQKKIYELLDERSKLHCGGCFDIGSSRVCSHYCNKRY